MHEKHDNQYCSHVLSTEIFQKMFIWAYFDNCSDLFLQLVHWKKFSIWAVGPQDCCFLSVSNPPLRLMVPQIFPLCLTLMIKNKRLSKNNNNKTRYIHPVHNISVEQINPYWLQSVWFANHINVLVWLFSIRVASLNENVMDVSPKASSHYPH